MEGKATDGPLLLVKRPGFDLFGEVVYLPPANPPAE